MNKFLAKLATDAYVRTQSQAVRYYIEQLCEHTGLSIDEITDPITAKEYTARGALICALRNLGLRIDQICEIAKTTDKETMRILRARTTYERPIRTTNWEAFA